MAARRQHSPFDPKFGVVLARESADEAALSIGHHPGHLKAITVLFDAIFVQPDLRSLTFQWHDLRKEKLRVASEVTYASQSRRLRSGLRNLVVRAGPRVGSFRCLSVLARRPIFRL